MKKVWVTAYEVSLEYGGREEGGWHFHWYHPAETLHVDADKVAEAEAELKTRHRDDLPGGSISSEETYRKRATKSRPVWS
jgi:hypothetical protein